jgi:hypothetical protein
MLNNHKVTSAIAASAFAALGTLPMAFVANAAPPSARQSHSRVGPVHRRHARRGRHDDGHHRRWRRRRIRHRWHHRQAYFTGLEHDGVIDLTSTYQDHLTATFDGTTLGGTLTMNDVARPFAASAVSAPAGMYTTELGDARATWVVRPDHTMMGMQDRMSRRDDELIGQLLQNQQDFQDQVRQLRVARQLEPAPQMMYGIWHVDMDGTPMTAVPVTGNTTF